MIWTQKRLNKIFEDLIYKLLSECMHFDEVYLFDIEIFNTYPESPKVIMIYFALVIVAYKSKKYMYWFKVIKRLCRKFKNTPLLWAIFNDTFNKLPSFIWKFVNKQGDDYDIKKTSIRSYVQRLIKSCQDNSENIDQVMPILHIMMGNNHLNALAYESAIESYTKAVSFEKFYKF